MRDCCPGQADLQFIQIHWEFLKLFFPAGDLEPFRHEFWNYATSGLETVFFSPCNVLHCSLCGSDGVGPGSDRKQTDGASPIV